MIALPIILATCAKEAKIKLPPDIENYDPDLYPHWHVYMIMQLGAPMPQPTSHWSNAVVVAAIPEDKIRVTTPEELFTLGFEIGYSIP